MNRMGFLGTLVHHPRKLWVRRAFFQVHLWAGVLLSLYIVMIAVTGSILVFRTELTSALFPKTLNPFDPDRTAPIATVLEHFKSAYPTARLDTLQMPSQPTPAFLLFATDRQRQEFTLLADPVTAELRSQPRTWLYWTYELHVNLLLGDAHGVQINGIGAVALMLLTLTGLVLWWPGIRLWARGLRIGLHHNWKRINYDTHHAIGFWTLFLVFWWALSGIYFAWYQQVESVVAAISPLQGMLTPTAPRKASNIPGRTSVDRILSAVHQASPNGQLFSLSDPLLAGDTIYALVDLRAPGDFSHRDIITISTTDARVLTDWHYGQNRTAGDWFLWAMHPFHFGTLWGMLFKIIWAVCGLSLAVLTITGLLMYWNRYLHHQF